MGHPPHSGTPIPVLCSGPLAREPNARATRRARECPTKNSSTSWGQLALELPSTLPAIAIEPEWKDQQRLWGHASTRCARTSRAFRRPSTHAFIARYSRPGDVVLDPFSGRGTTPLQACAEGRIGVGNDLNPFAHLLTAAKVQPATKAEAVTRLAAASPGLERGLRGVACARSACRGGPDERRLHGPARGLRRRSAVRGTESVPSRSRSRSTRERSPNCCTCERCCDLDDRTDRFLAAAITGILHGKSASYLSVDAEHVQHGAALRARFRRPDGLRVAGARRLRWPRRSWTASFASPSAHRGPRLAGRRPRRRGAGTGGTARDGPPGPSPARRHVAAIPARRQVRLLQLASDLVPGLRCPRDRRDPGRRPSPRALSRLPARLAGGLRPILTDDAVVVLVIGDVETDRGQARSGAGSASPSASGSRPPGPRGTGWPASRSTMSPRTAR